MHLTIYIKKLKSSLYTMTLQILSENERPSLFGCSVEEVHYVGQTETLGVLLFS